jgi:hypothetical protein
VDLIPIDIIDPIADIIGLTGGIIDHGIIDGGIHLIGQVTGIDPGIIVQFMLVGGYYL